MVSGKDEHGIQYDGYFGQGRRAVGDGETILLDMGYCQSSHCVLLFLFVCLFWMVVSIIYFILQNNQITITNTFQKWPQLFPCLYSCPLSVTLKFYYLLLNGNEERCQRETRVTLLSLTGHFNGAFGGSRQTSMIGLPYWTTRVTHSILGELWGLKPVNFKMRKAAVEKKKA